jgi:regulator of sigma E protease
VTIISAILLLGILIFAHELGHFLVAKLSGVKVLKFSLGFGPKVVGRRFGETEYLLSLFPLGGYVKMLGEEPGEELLEEERARAFNFQPLFKRALIVLAGPVFNILLTYIIFTGVIASGGSITVPDAKNFLPVIDEVQKGYPAEVAGFKAGDRVLKIDNREIDTWFDMVEIVSRSPGKALNFVVKRGDETLNIKIIPREEEIKGTDGKVVKIGRIGVMKTSGSPLQLIKAKKLTDAPWLGLVATYRMSVFIVDTVKMLIAGDVSLKNIAGPGTIISESGKAASAGVLPYLMFMALLSVNLGILNLLPIPILDGGHLMFYLIEALRGKPLKEKTMVVIQRIGLAILIALMAFAIYNDIVRFISGGNGH